MADVSENRAVPRGLITSDHLAGMPGRRRAARAALLARQPKTVLKALGIPNVGRKATKHLLVEGLLTDPDSAQTGGSHGGRRSR